MRAGRVAACGAVGLVGGWAAVQGVLRPGAGSGAVVAPLAASAALTAVGARSTGAVPLALGAAAVGLAVGWSAASVIALRSPPQQLRRAGPRPPGAPRRRVVVYFTHGEPETYQPKPWLTMLDELSATVPGFPPKPVWPVILLGIRRAFAAVGNSPHGRIHAQTLAAVRARVGRDDVDWRLAFLDAAPTLGDVVADAADDGATDLVLLTVFLTDSDHTAHAVDLDAAMGLSEAGIRTIVTPVLWDDPRLAQMVADKVVAAVGSRERGEVGVMLAGHGQPKQWDAGHPTETAQEVGFRAAVRDELVSRGFDPRLVAEGWMSFREPKVPDGVRALTRRGATTVVGVPVAISADSLHSLHDIPRQVRRGARGAGVEVLDVGGWNTEALLVEILADRALDALDRLGHEGPAGAPGDGSEAYGRAGLTD